MSSIKLIGPSRFFGESFTANLKIKTDNPDNYRKIISYHKDINAKYNTLIASAVARCRTFLFFLIGNTPASRESHKNDLREKNHHRLFMQINNYLQKKSRFLFMWGRLTSG